YTFEDIDPTNSTITFHLSGSTSTADGSFVINLGNFVTTDGSIVTSITYGNGNFDTGDFSQVSFDGATATFTGSTASFYDAIGGRDVVFNVALEAAPPEPASVMLTGLGMVGLALVAKRRRA